MSNKANAYKMFIPKHSLHLLAVILLLTLSAEANTKRFVIERQVARIDKIILKNGELNSIVEIDSCLLRPMIMPIDKKTRSKEKTEIDIFPMFPRGEYGFADYLKSALKYPDEARANNASGKVYIKFVVQTDGSLAEIRVLKGIGYGCDEEVVRVIATCPKWSSGMYDNKPVRVSYSMPVYFKLEN